MLVLYQPEIPQNVGTLLRLGACLQVPVHVIEPCGFLWGERRLRRAGMDYMDLALVHRHGDWQAFLHWYQENKKGGLFLLTPQGNRSYLDTKFSLGDLLVLGQESCGVPDFVAEACDDSLSIPMVSKVRSLNVAVAGAMVLGEALRQGGGFPPFTHSR